MIALCDGTGCHGWPIFGAAPHKCFYRKPGGAAANPLGTSTIDAVKDWPDNFLAEIDPDEPIKEQLSSLLCGTYYCPNCKRGMKENANMLGKESIERLVRRENSK